MAREIRLSVRDSVSAVSASLADGRPEFDFPDEEAAWHFSAEASFVLRRSGRVVIVDGAWATADVKSPQERQFVERIARKYLGVRA